MTYLLLMYAVLASGNVQSGLAQPRFEDAEKCQSFAEFSIVNLLPPSADGSPWQHTCIGVSAVERESEAPDPDESETIPDADEPVNPTSI